MGLEPGEDNNWWTSQLNWQKKILHEKIGEASPGMQKGE
jgi:hypothetical protein